MEKQDTLNQMGHVARCHKILFHKDLSIFNLFYDNFMLEKWTSKSLFSKNERLFSKASYLIHISIFNHQIFSIVLCDINLSQYYITIELFIHKGHYIKVYWVHLIYLWLDMCFCTIFKIHNKLNIENLTMKF
jgi:hypothetical protein